MTKKLNCPMCHKGKIEDYTCTFCGFTDIKMKKMHEVMDKHE